MTDTVDLRAIAVRPEAVAEIVDALSPRLRKRLDAAVDKLAARPVTQDADTVRIAVDEDAELTLHAPGSLVRTAEDVRCSCLLAPACVHRAAAVSSLTPSVDDEPAAPEPETTDPSAPAPAADDATAAPVGSSHGTCAQCGVALASPVLNPQGGGPSSRCDHHTAAPGSASAADTAVSVPASAAGAALTGQASSAGAALTTQASSAAQALWSAAATVLDAGVSGSGAVLQAGLLRAAHAAKLAGLHRPAAAAVAVTTGLRAARADDPSHRLADLIAATHELLDTARELSRISEGPEPGSERDRPTPDATAVLIGTARQPYTHAGSLRLYGVFTEPINTATGHAGVVTYTLAPGSRALRTVSDVMPGGAARIAGAAARAVRLGDTALDHHQLSRAGLIVSGATESPTGRLGAGASVRAVSASGAAWHDDPLAALWAEPPADQVARVLRTLADLPPDARPAGSDLVFLDVELLGPVASASGADRVAARCGGLTVHLLVADDHPALPYRDNLRLLATRPGLRLRIVGRLEPGAQPAVRALAAGPAPVAPSGETAHDPTPDTLRVRVNLGLDRLQRADVTAPTPTSPTSQAAPARREHAPSPDHSGARPPQPAPAPAFATPDQAPAYLLSRHVERAVSGGRAALALAAAPVSATASPAAAPLTPMARDAARLRRDGLVTGADLLEALVAASADRGRDVFGRLLPGDADALARAWLAATTYTRAVDAALTAHAWAAPDPV
ncbi:hypothetical protein [Yinghuangia seranimata]|uniref:hypothetical protein n=1 Tax=Yinghuangia seranimata TaxID=408067 RepID=UPI00248B603E|nr:hypothetical protein [Yinghuangia seranimata]MDI2126915.1 hypothetical protein [Yinghuangia seranimata]